MEYSYFYICKIKFFIYVGDEIIEYKLYIRICVDFIDLKEIRRLLVIWDLDYKLYKVIFNFVNNDNFFEKLIKWLWIMSNDFLKVKKKKK